VSVALAALVSLAGQAFAQGNGVPSKSAVQECARAYESSQEHRGAGAISSARAEFERCQRDDCPAFIRSDCSRWSKELEAEQPTVIFSAKRGTRKLTDVRVSVGGRVLVEQLNDQAVELDPGEYDFRFEMAESGLVVQHALIQAGNKDRLVQVEFAPLAQAQGAGLQPHRLPHASDTGQPSNTQSAPAPAPSPQVLPWVLLGIGATSLGTGAALSVWGGHEELELRETCSPICTDSQVQPVRTKYLLSNVSFGAGIASLSTALYLFLRHPDAEHAAKGTVPVTIVASPTGFQAAYGARF